MNALRDKLFEDMPQEERIAAFVEAHKWGDPYSTEDFYDWHHRLTGSCEMGRREFAASKGMEISEDVKITVAEFIELTKNSYGGSIIRDVKKRYEDMRGDT